VTPGLLNALFHEGELFMARTLWDGALSELLTSQNAYVNDQIAMPIYGVTAPTRVDADGFGLVELPADRAGLLTSSPFLTSRSRPDGASVVGRGLTINATLMCQVNPPFPEGDGGFTPEDITNTVGLTEREQAEYRAERPLCAGCHVQFDAFGLVLDSYDAVGRFRTMDREGRPIDPVVALPEVLDGQVVASAAEMAAAIVESGRFEACLAMNLVNFAFMEESQGSVRVLPPNEPASSCAVEDVVRAARAGGELTFASLVTEIARSRVLRYRRVTP